MIESNIFSYPEVKSLDTPCKKLVVFLHGLGSDGHDLIGLVPFISKELPECHFIAPHGIEQFDNAPYGRQWFSLNNRTPHIIEGLVKRNVSLIINIIQKKQLELNLTNKNTIIIGFSQGTMIGLYLNFIQRKPFACVVGFSGKLIAPQECINSTTPVCVIHGESDNVIDINSVDEIIEYLQKYNIPHGSYKIPNLAHSIDERALNFAVNFIKLNTFFER